MNCSVEAWVFLLQDGVKALVEKGYRKITPFFIPYAITNMGEHMVMVATANSQADGCLLEYFQGISKSC